MWRRVKLLEKIAFISKRRERVRDSPKRGERYFHFHWDFQNAFKYCEDMTDKNLRPRRYKNFQVCLCETPRSVYIIFNKCLLLRMQFTVVFRFLNGQCFFTITVIEWPIYLVLHIYTHNCNHSLNPVSISMFPNFHSSCIDKALSKFVYVPLCMCLCPSSYGNP